MSVVKKNIVASFVGNIWQVLMGLAFIPFYIKLLGAESYGLIGIFAMLQGVLSILDMGLSATVTRELARLSALSNNAQETRNFVRSLEIIYWVLAFLIGLIVVVMAPIFAHYWISANEFSSQTIEEVIRVMGFALALQWPASFYSGGLVGLQRQITLNGINIAISTLRGVGAVLILLFYASTIQVFFYWQIIISVINSFGLAFYLWRAIPRSAQRPTFEKKLVIDIWKFAAGISGITVLSTIFTQLDKIILSRLLPLHIFAYYTIASIVAMNLIRLVTPVFTAVYPRFTQFVELNEQKNLIDLYHKSSQFISVLILPVAFIVAMFSHEILLLWTQDLEVARESYLTLSILILGTSIFGLLHIPYALQLANGWTKLSFYTNLIALIFYIPMLIFMAYRFGALGAAISWLLLNVMEMVVPIYFMHKKLLRTEKWFWYRNDILSPLIMSFTISGIFRLIITESESQLKLALYILVASFFTLFGAIFSTPTTRHFLLNLIEKCKKHHRKI
jgi:O-antigen/teichoic acid export membrane protein